MKRIALAWAAALAFTCGSVAGAQTMPRAGVGPEHAHPNHPFHPNPPVRHRIPGPGHDRHRHHGPNTGVSANGFGNGNGYYVNVPSSYIDSALAAPMPVRAPKPRATPYSIYETFSTVTNRPQ